MHGTLRYLFLSHLLYAILCKNLYYESVYFKELENDHEYFIDHNIQSRDGCSVSYY